MRFWCCCFAAMDVCDCVSWSVMLQTDSRDTRVCVLSLHTSSSRGGNSGGSRGGSSGGSATRLNCMQSCWCSFARVRRRSSYPHAVCVLALRTQHTRVRECNFRRDGAQIICGEDLLLCIKLPRWARRHLDATQRAHIGCETLSVTLHQNVCEFIRYKFGFHCCRWTHSHYSRTLHVCVCV